MLVFLWINDLWLMATKIWSVEFYWKVYNFFFDFKISLND